MNEVLLLLFFLFVDQKLSTVLISILDFSRNFRRRPLTWVLCPDFFTYTDPVTYIRTYVVLGQCMTSDFFFRTRPVRFDRYSSPNGINEMVKNWVEQIEGALKCSFFPIIYSTKKKTHKNVNNIATSTTS